MQTIFDKIPPLSKIENCEDVITISCPPGMDILKKAIFRFHEKFIFLTFDMDDVKTTFTMEKKINFQEKVVVNGVPKYLNILEKTFSFSDRQWENIELKYLFNFIKGFTCAKDKLFIHPRGNYYVLVGEDKVERYIYVPDEYPCFIKEFNEHLEKHKADLMMNKFDKWYTWYDSSGIEEFEKHYNTDFILYDTKTKKAFIKTLIHFSNRYICLIPLYKDIDLKKVVQNINNSNGINLKTIVY